MLDLTKRLLDAAEGGTPVLQASLIDPGPTSLALGARMLVEPGGDRMGSLGDVQIDDLVAGEAEAAFGRHGAETVYVTESGLSRRTVAGAAAIYLEVVESRPTFVIVGGGHIGRSLATLGRFLDFHVTVIDDREEFADRDRIPAADEIVCEDFEVALDSLEVDSNTAIVMVTRGHKQDEISLRHSLGRGAGYVGMIGSRRRTAAVLEHLRGEGFTAEELAKVRTPIGLDIGAETPEEIALSIMAEMVLLRRGGTGGPMYYRRGE